MGAGVSSTRGIAGAGSRSLRGGAGAAAPSGTLIGDELVDFLLCELYSQLAEVVGGGASSTRRPLARLVSKFHSEKDIP